MNSLHQSDLPLPALQPSEANSQIPPFSSEHPHCWAKEALLASSQMFLPRVLSIQASQALFPVLFLLNASLSWTLLLRCFCSTTGSSFPWVPTAATCLNCIVLKALVLGRMRKEPKDENKTFHRVPMDTPCHPEAHAGWGWVTLLLATSFELLRRITESDACNHTTKGVPFCL